MGIYEKYLLPKLLNAAMKAPMLTRLRAQLVPLASGKVLEIGIGSGLNLPFYSPGVILTALDPSKELQVYAREIAHTRGISVDFVDAGGESIPASANTFDTVVMTWTLCTIPEPATALQEIRRVLKPEGRVIFAEHGKAPDLTVAKLQDRLNPLWRAVAGGCHLNRQMDQLFHANGFVFDDVQTGYLEGPRFATYNYRGLARIG